VVDDTGQTQPRLGKLYEIRVWSIFGQITMCGIVVNQICSRIILQIFEMQITDKS